MKSVVTYDKSNKILECENEKCIPKFCQSCFSNPNKKCIDYYNSLLKSEKDGLYTCPYMFKSYVSKNLIYTCFVTEENIAKIRNTFKYSKDNIKNFQVFTDERLINYLADLEELRFDNVALRDCMHDLRNMGGFFNAMSERISSQSPEFVNSSDDAKAMLSLYDLVNYRINILNGIRSSDYRRIRQKMHPLIKKLTIMLSYQAKKKDIKFKICNLQEKQVDLSNNIYLAMFILLENAVKHSFSEETINISFEEKDDKLKIIIENMGAVIEDDELDKLFIRGYRGKNTATKGTGVGLALAKEIFENHKNCIFEIKATKINNHKCLFSVIITFDAYD